MALYTLASRTSNVTSGVACWELITSSTRRPRILEIGLFNASTTACTYGLGRPAAIGVTPTSPVTVLPQDAADGAGASQVALAWGTAPTTPTSSNYLRRISTPATSQGSGVIWTFGPKELVVPVSSSLVLYNLASNGVMDIYVVLDE